MKKTISDEATTPLPYEERMATSGPEKVFLIDATYVKQMVASIVKDQDLSQVYSLRLPEKSAQITWCFCRRAMRRRFLRCCARGPCGEKC